MIGEHRKLEKTLKKFLRNPKEYSFEVFEKRVAEHFGAEKGVIFTLTEKFLGKELDAILKLKGQHIEILKEIVKIKKNLAAKELIDTMRGHLEAHTLYEEKVFYPKLDYSLDNEQKKELLQKLREAL